MNSKDRKSVVNWICVVCCTVVVAVGACVAVGAKLVMNQGEDEDKATILSRMGIVSFVSVIGLGTTCLSMFISLFGAKE